MITITELPRPIRSMKSLIESRYPRLVCRGQFWHIPFEESRRFDWRGSAVRLVTDDSLATCSIIWFTNCYCQLFSSSFLI